jgi:DNA-directed RNA polymerase subunit H (RpoH/RPB5)
MANLKPQNSPFEITERILQTVRDMLKDRGYSEIVKSEWTDYHKQIYDLKYIAQFEKEVLFVYFATDIKVPVKKAREYVAHMDEGGITHAIVVYSSQITSGASNEFYETDKITKKYDFELFQAVELYENPTLHSLVPRHEKVANEEKVQEVMNKFHMKTKADFPVIYTSDIIVRYYHWPVGSVVRIYRYMGALQEPFIYYRCVREWQK